MDSSKNSNLGDWIFLVGSLGAIGGYLAYENKEQINAWLMAIQSPAATPNTVAMAVDNSVGVWLASNWGMVALVAAIIFASIKWVLAQRSGAVGSTAGPAVTYKQYNFVNVKLVR